MELFLVKQVKEKARLKDNLCKFSNSIKIKSTSYISCYAISIAIILILMKGGQLLKFINILLVNNRYL